MTGFLLWAVPLGWDCYVNVEGHWYPENQVYSERPAG